MFPLIRSALFKLDPETAHTATLDALRSAHCLGTLPLLVKQPAYDPRPAMGLIFPNPIGLAAGLDKNGACIDALAALGFGFIEIGTVTPRPQPGNPKPRLFRLPADKALINRMGFNNDGATEAANRLRKRKEHVIIGGNIGKNKDTANEQAADDYEKCFRELYDAVDYFVVNVSSP